MNFLSIIAILILLVLIISGLDISIIKPFCSSSTRSLLNTVEKFSRSLPLGPFGPFGPFGPTEIPQYDNKQQKTRNVSESLKKQVASDQKWLCKTCKEMLDYTYEIDHIIPLFKGGSNDRQNLQALCRQCHGKKTHNERT